MNEDSNFIVSMIVFIFFLAFQIYVTIEWLSTYQVYKSEWKCQKAIIINDDPSKTECVIYSKKEKQI